MTALSIATIPATWWTGVVPAWRWAWARSACWALGSGDFAFQWQPVPPDVPARGALAMAAGALEVLAAVLLLLSGRLRAVGAWLAAVLLLGWAALHVPSIVQRPTSVADWLGIAETAAMASARADVRGRLVGRRRGGRGAARRHSSCSALSALVFGVSHFVYADFTASMIPAWLPARVRARAASPAPRTRLAGPGDRSGRAAHARPRRWRRR